MKKAVRTVPCFVDAGQGPRQRSSPLLGGLLLAASLGLSACGGSGASNLSVSARVEGLREAGLVLSLTPQSAAFAIAPNASSHTFFDVVPNFSHDITVRKHPLNQLCQVVNGRGTAGSAAAQGASIVCQRTLLNDTGSELADDGGEGRDAVVASTLTKVGSGDKGFDFTRLCVKDAGGAVEVCKGPLPKSTADVNAAVSADPGGWVCTRDNVTGLVWRVHDPAGNDGLCGIPAGEWFLPSSHELASVLDLGRFNPALSQDYLPHLGSENYQVTMSGGTFFYLQAGDGTVAKGLALPVMVARSKALTSSFTQVSKPEDRLFVSGSLELMWHLPASPAQATYEQARSDAAALKVGGHNDWRLPNQKELMSLFDRDHGCVTEGCVPLAYLPPDSAAGEAFWSSTVFAGDVIPANSDKSRWLLAPVAGGFTTEFRSPYLSGRAIFVRNLSGDEVPGP